MDCPGSLHHQLQRKRCASVQYRAGCVLVYNPVLEETALVS
ncbi:unnamed protein product [Moneuplotes crassus]|uniref:Uncharacterized protein n=1 Tax=Euplotes crassus TaxID=5936 RepID=A0AAD1UBH1_EUPCR|nr:unnamed protein product [Moneuplotes crassus]